MRTIREAVDCAGFEVGRPPGCRINACSVSYKKPIVSFLCNLAVIHCLPLTIRHEIEISHAGH